MGKSSKILFRHRQISILSTLILAAVVSLVIVFPVFAQTTDESTTDTSVSTENTTIRPRPLAEIRQRIQNAKAKAQELRSSARQRASDAAQIRQEKLSAARLRICQARANNISKRVTFMLEHGVAVNRGHVKIEERVDEFYNNRLVANGYELDNYETLKEEIETTKANVLTLLNLAKESGADFDCESDDPKSQIDAFKEDIRELILANKAYKESVHNFVRAVLALAKEARADQAATISPEPTEGEEE